EDQIHALGLQGQAPGVRGPDIPPLRAEIEPDAVPAEVATHVQGRATAAEWIEHHLTGRREPLEHVPDDEGGRRAGETLAALLRVTIVLRGVFPERGHLFDQGGLLERHGALAPITKRARPAPPGCCGRTALTRRTSPPGREKLPQPEPRAVHDDALDGRAQRPADGCRRRPRSVTAQQGP